jgi:hypothetical protein
MHILHKIDVRYFFICILIFSQHSHLRNLSTQSKFRHVQYAKCRHLKKFTLRQVLIRVYRLEISCVSFSNPMLVFSTQLCDLYSPLLETIFCRSFTLCI